MTNYGKQKAVKKETTPNAFVYLVGLLGLTTFFIGLMVYANIWIWGLIFWRGARRINNDNIHV